MAITLKVPTEGIFRTRTDVPDLALLINGQLRFLPLDKFGKGATFGKKTENGLENVLKQLGMKRKEFDRLNIFNPANLANQFGQGSSIQPEEFKQFVNQPAKETERTFETPALGSLAQSVGSAREQFQVPQPAQTASGQVEQTQNQFAGAASPSGASIDPNTRILTLPNGQRIHPDDKQTYDALVKQHGLTVPPITGNGQVEAAGVAGEEKKFTDISELPEEIRNNPLFKKLDTDQQEVVAGSWRAMQADSVLTQIRWNEAMKDATKLADPIFKSQLRLAQDQLERSITSLIANNESARKEIETKIGDLRENLKIRGDRMEAEVFEQQLRDAEGLAVLVDRADREAGSREGQMKADVVRIKNRIEDIEGDLETRRGDITVDEEKALARQLRQYRDELKQAQQGAVNAGLGFSSVREEAEQRLKEELQDVSESTRRQAARQIRDIELETGRGKRDLGLQREDIERKNQEARVDLARELERRVGFENIPENIRSTLGESFEILRTQKGQQVRSELEQKEQERKRQAEQEKEDIERTRQRAERERETDLAELERSRKEKLTAGVREGEALLGTANLPKLATEEIKPLGTLPRIDPITGLPFATSVGTTPPIRGTLEHEQTERIGKIRQSLMESQPLFSSQL